MKKSIKFIILIIIAVLLLVGVIIALNIRENGFFVKIKKVRDNEQTSEEIEDNIELKYVDYFQDASSAMIAIVFTDENGIDTLECPQMGNEPAMILNANGAKKIMKDYQVVPAGEEFIFIIKSITGEIKEQKLLLPVYDEIRVLEYPIITLNGVCNVEYIDSNDSTKSVYAFNSNFDATNSQAMPKKAYDRNMNTFAGPYNLTAKYLEIDPSVLGKTIRVICCGTNLRYNHEYSSYTWTKVTGGSYGYFDRRREINDIVPPSDASGIWVYGNEDCCFKEITVLR